LLEAPHVAQASAIFGGTASWVLNNSDFWVADPAFMAGRQKVSRFNARAQ
jgi:hypothetical protein